MQNALRSHTSWGFGLQGFHTGDQLRSLFYLRGRKKRKKNSTSRTVRPGLEAFTPANPAPRSFPGKHTARGNEN